MELEIAGNTSVVTAGASGLGKATATEFVREGTNVVLNDIDGDALAKSADEIGKVGDRNVVHVQGDLTDPDDIKELITTAISEFGSIDHLVTSTGGPGAGPFTKWDDDD